MSCVVLCVLCFIHWQMYHHVFKEPKDAKLCHLRSDYYDTLHGRREVGFRPKHNMQSVHWSIIWVRKEFIHLKKQNRDWYYIVIVLVNFASHIFFSWCWKVSVWLDPWPWQQLSSPWGKSTIGIAYMRIWLQEWGALTLRITSLSNHMNSNLWLVSCMPRRSCKLRI